MRSSRTGGVVCRKIMGCRAGGAGSALFLVCDTIDNSSKTP